MFFFFETSFFNAFTSKASFCKAWICFKACVLSTGTDWIMLFRGGKMAGDPESDLEVVPRSGIVFCDEIFDSS